MMSDFDRMENTYKNLSDIFTQTSFDYINETFPQLPKNQKYLVAEKCDQIIKKDRIKVI